MQRERKIVRLKQSEQSRKARYEQSERQTMMSRQVCDCTVVQGGCDEALAIPNFSHPGQVDGVYFLLVADLCLRICMCRCTWRGCMRLI